MHGSFTKSYAFGGGLLKFEPTSNLELSIELSLDGFSFMVSTLGHPTIIEEYLINESMGDLEYSNWLDKLFEQLNFSRFSFQRITVLLRSPNLIFVPKDVFDPNLSESLFKFCVPNSNPKIKVIDHLPAIGCNGIFELPTEIEMVLKKQFQNFDLQHSATCLINWFLNSTLSNSSLPQVVVQPFKSGFNVFYFENKQLLAYNTFKCLEYSDFLYYLIFFLEQFDLDFSQLQVHLLTKNEDNQTFVENILQLFPNVLKAEPHLHRLNQP